VTVLPGIWSARGALPGLAKDKQSNHLTTGVRQYHINNSVAFIAGKPADL